VAFSAQWGIGSVIELWPIQAGGGYAPEGYRAAFIIMLVAQGATWIWFIVATFYQRRRRGLLDEH
jgi:hypothetical protein